MEVYVRVYDLTKSVHLSGRTIKSLIKRGIITADAALQMAQSDNTMPLFRKERFNELVATLLIYKEQREMTLGKAEAKLAGDGSSDA